MIMFSSKEASSLAVADWALPKKYKPDLIFAGMIDIFPVVLLLIIKGRKSQSAAVPSVKHILLLYRY